MKALLVSAELAPKPGYTVTEWERTTGKYRSGNNVWCFPQLDVVERPIPTLTPDQVLIRVRACGVCGSDLHFYEADRDGYMLYPGLTRFPRVTGHEYSGEIVEVGTGVRGLRPGDMVCSEEMLWCGACLSCRNGYFNHCEQLDELGFTVDGAFAEYLTIDQKYCWKIDAIAERYGDAERAFEAAALVEPTSVAYNGLFNRMGGFRPGSYAAVYGAGPIGLTAIGLLRAAGAARVIAFDTSAPRRALAQRLGADVAYDPAQLHESGTSAGAAVLNHTEGRGADVHVEAAGVPERTMVDIERSLAIDAKVLIIGRSHTRTPVYLEQFQVRHSQIFGTQGHSGNSCYPNVIRLMASGLLDLSPMITSRFHLADAVDAIHQGTKRTDGKILVRMP